MKTRALLLALPLLAAAGCNDNRATVTVDHICQPTDDCAFTGECDQALSIPTLDLTNSTRDNVWLYLQVTNQAPDNTNLAAGHTNTNGAHIDEYVIEYEGVFTGKIVQGQNPAGVAAGSTAVVKVEVIPDALNIGSSVTPPASGDPVEVLARLRLRGYFDDGTRFETGEFPITVRLCAGCVGLLCGGGATCPPNVTSMIPFSCPT